MSDSVRPHRWQPTRLPRPWDSPGKNTEVGCHFLLQCMKVKSESEVTQSCWTLSYPMDCSLPGSSVHGIFQARVLEWVAIAFSDINTQEDTNIWLAAPSIYDLSSKGTWASQVALVVKNPPANAGDVRTTGLIPGLGRSPRRGHSNPLLYSCLENPMDRGDSWGIQSIESQRDRHDWSDLGHLLPTKL